MAENQYDDEYRLRRHRQFVLELQREIGPINRDLVHEDLPCLTKDRCLELATLVARSRAAYVQLALKLGRDFPDSLPDDGQIDQLREARQRFDELREAFSAMERAVECGYLDIELPD
jgi:hypothetical protein